MSQYTNKNQKTIDVAADSTSNPVHIKDSTSPITVGLHPTGSATVQYTISNKQDIVDGNAYWVDWDIGSVTAGTVQVIIGAVTAIRVVTVGGPAVLEILY